MTKYSSCFVIVLVFLIEWSTCNSIPSALPTKVPSKKPSWNPTGQPSSVPSEAPTFGPPPFLLSLESLGVDKTSATVVAVSNEDSIVYCGAFLPSVVLTNDNEAKLIVSQLFSTRTVENSADVTVNGLAPSTEYSIACIAFGLNSPSYDSSQSVLVTTECCKDIDVSLSVNLMKEGKFTSSGLSLTLSHYPSSVVTMTFVSGCGSSLTFSPPSVTVFSDSATLMYSVDMIANHYGNCSVSITLSDESAPEYTVSYSGSMSVQLLSSAAIPPVPILKSAQFVSDGSAIVVSFDTDTDQGGVSNYFGCNKLLTFVGSSTSTCK